MHVVLAFSPVGDAFRTRDSLGNLETDGQLHQCAGDQHYTKAYLNVSMLVSTVFVPCLLFSPVQSPRFANVPILGELLHH